ncbi:double-strand break repair helicase AddA [Sphingomonas gilva]|uniref:DNA 3'-5' helicase n=1 Tax=Sphingomonas gilva TaxID=2305907 RepID=A0A396RU84_9SPHN|nr:double-strand break repair helicase AddA [Sphingomonas gilva]RHW17261.1 double-strand break repair helicase AddA [Sphingomonas gilva]
MAERGFPRLKGAQREASAPGEHVWLSASAGTGKTQVLTARVLRLLLAGVDPSAILCITFTKAGAAEMAERISARLARWVRLKDADLAADLIALGEDHGPERVERARTLFARVLDAPGGLRIQTIHAFCQSLLGSFPAEAGLAPGFRPLDAREEAKLAREALAAMLLEAEAGGEALLIESIAALSLRLGEGGAENFLLECARAPVAMASLPTDRTALGAMVRRLLGVPEGDVEQSICAACEALDTRSLQTIVAANRAWATATGVGHADIADRWLAGDPTVRAATIADLAGIALTAKGELRKFSARLIGFEADYEALAADLAQWCSGLLQMRALAGYADDLAAALWVGRRYAAAYAAAKRHAAAVDFDDLIRRTLDLLATPGMGDWVRFKLDRATDHILVDESQDTNAQQWAIVERLAEEYFAVAREDAEKVRTLFTVGDFKQAIFGFQGTDPAEYRAARERFAELARQASHAFNTLSLTHSFRSTRPILEFVDAAIAEVGPVELGDERLEAHASEVKGPGAVTLWQPVTDADLVDPGEEGWVPDPTRALADRVALQVRRWLDQPLMLESQGRPLGAGDVMILVRKRGELASLLVARLHATGVPVAGIDRLRLNAPLAVQDLLAAVRFVLQPLDDLNLAGLLVSPLIGWSQDELYRRGRRGGAALWPHLQATCDPALLDPLRAMLARADFVPPYRFLEDILSGPLDGRRRLLARLGPEARDPIEELLGAALQFEANDTPTLQAFLDWFDRGDVDIKRDASGPGDAVRVMTVHGAKGLQAPLVILADATGDPDRSRTDLFGLDAGLGEPLPVFSPRKEERAGPIAEALETQKRRDRAEHWRLFYVAMTRAEERLVLAGALAKGKGEAPGDSWWARAALAMQALGGEEVEEGQGKARRFVGRTPEPPVKPRARPASAPTEPFAPPAWLRTPAPVEARPPRPLAPSALGEDDVATPPPGPAMRAAAERGRALHALFERLPALPPDRRAAAAQAWLAQRGFDAAEAGAIAATALGIIADPAHTAIFAPAALAEAPLTAVLADGTVVSGVVDRLVVTPDAVRIVDFKTGRAPAAFEEVPTYHLRQMAAYAAALRIIFPGRSVSASLLYTAGPALFDLAPELLERHKPGYADAEQSLSSPA